METHIPDDVDLFRQKALQWAASFETACYFDSNSYTDPYSSFDVLIAAGASEGLESNAGSAFEELAGFIENSPQWIIGFLAYDLKNETESLSSANPDHLNFPDLYFFKPKHLITIKAGQVKITSESPASVITEINCTSLTTERFSFQGTVKTRFTPDEYQAAVRALKDHIHRGDIYEANFCQEFYADNCVLNPLEAFKSLNTISPTPFATFFKYNHRYIISATPERFLSKRRNKIISQPIKGTIKRSADFKEDQYLKESLRNNEKEQSENVMIVDLVRNDLTKCAIPGTVEVEELFGIYTFEQVHQMISTVICQAKPGLSNAEIIRAVFPMGSMTGAPKISAMELIEKYERSKRGVFSGAIGYFSPDGDFDFNVVIRTLLYNAAEGYLSFHVGSAITFASDPQKEYDECLLKAEAIRRVLSESIK
ncbi:anthranilate synthase component I family protein [Paradesertivirga mongoliensis]|uniref:Anthranilate synthase component I family protein n=1 Tax=Paradesertivirga mongoliensis TaxID=2100740 RepID=A0ABW4ZMU6_9SPHI|nr:anthranilate synthase component I family protein [Pedobacter mongoliensis]